MKQKTLDEGLQNLAVELAILAYPAIADQIEVPLVVALPTGIHPYNKLGGYYDDSVNAIVLYQRIGRLAIDGKYTEIKNIIQHELAHWYQFKHLGEKGNTTTNIHRKASWSQACFVATQNLFPNLKLQRWQFSPYTSERLNGKVRRISKDGALSDVQLHHWPDSLLIT